MKNLKNKKLFLLDMDETIYLDTFRKQLADANLPITTILEDDIGCLCM